MIHRNHTIVIGIDPGTETGLAIWNRSQKKFEGIWTLPIHRAINMVKGLCQINPGNVSVRFEDARKRKFFKGENVIAKAQGAGSIKRDCSIWQDFLEDENIPYDNPAAAKIKTKYKPEMFQKITGWDKKTSNHARDAAMLVFNL